MNGFASVLIDELLTTMILPMVILMLLATATLKLLAERGRSRLRTTRTAEAELDHVKALRARLEELSALSGDVDSSVSEYPKLSKRVDAIEERLPPDAALDKVASANDAILATRLDDIVRRMDRMEATMMTPEKVLGWLVVAMTLFVAGLTLIGWSWNAGGDNDDPSPSTSVSAPSPSVAPR